MASREVATWAEWEDGGWVKGVCLSDFFHNAEDVWQGKIRISGTWYDLHSLRRLVRKYVKDGGPLIPHYIEDFGLQAQATIAEED